MNKNDVSTITTGRYELTNGCYVNVDEYETTENNNFEENCTYVDVLLWNNSRRSSSTPFVIYVLSQ